MRFILKSLGILALICLIFAIGYGVHYHFKVKPYFTLPDVDEPYLMGKLKEYNVMLSELQRRPALQREKLSELFSRISSDFPDFDAIPIWECDKTESVDSTLDSEKLDRLLKNYSEIVGDELVIDPGDLAFDDTFSSNIFQKENIIIHLLNKAVALAETGYEDHALEALDTALTTTRGLNQSYVFVHVMTGSLIDAHIDGAIVRILPTLSDKHLETLKQKLAQRPSHLKALPTCLMMEVSVMAKRLDTKNLILDYAKHSEKTLRTIKLADKFLLREMLLYLKIAVPVAESYREWKKDTSAPFPDSKIKDEEVEGTIAGLANRKYSNIFGNVRDDEALNKAVLKAVELEKKRRKTGDKKDIELRVDDKRLIKIGKDSGCIVQINSQSTEKPQN